MRITERIVIDENILWILNQAPTMDYFQVVGLKRYILGRGGNLLRPRYR